MHRARSLLLLFAFITLVQAADPTKDPIPSSAPDDRNSKIKLERKLNNLIIPTLQLRGATLEESLEYLRKQSRELLKSSDSSGIKGVNIILRPGKKPPHASISLDLKDVPFSEALRYVTELSQMKYKIVGQNVLVVSLTEEEEDASEIITRTFKVPSDFLTWSLSDLAAHNAPSFDPFAPSSAHQGEATMGEFLAWNSSPSHEATDPFSGDPLPATPPPKLPANYAKQMLEAAGIEFPAGTSIAYNLNTSLLKVTNSRRNLDIIEAYVNEMREGDPAPRSILYQVTVIEGPGELIRQVSNAAAKAADLGNELIMLHSLTQNAASKVRVVGAAFLNTTSGSRATTEAVMAHKHIMQDAKTPPSEDDETRLLGLRLELEPRLAADRVSIVSDLSLELHPASFSENKPVGVSSPISGTPVESPSPGIAETRFATSIASRSGATSLIGITRAVGGGVKESDDILWAAFLTGTVNSVESRPGPKPPEPLTKTKLPPGMIDTTFPVSQGLLESVIMPPQLPLRTWLENSGIPFPKGAVLEQKDGFLHVINMPDRVATIAALIIEVERSFPKTAAFTLHTVQAPAAFLRELAHAAATSGEHSAQWVAVESAVARGEATFINSCFLETKFGTRATLESASEHRYLRTTGVSSKGLPIPALDMRHVGALFEIEPTIGADGRTVAITFSQELHSAPPETRAERSLDPVAKRDGAIPTTDFHALKTTSNLTMTRGGIQLISLQHPTGRGDAEVLWATFLHCDVVAQASRKPQEAQANHPRIKLPASQLSEEMQVRLFDPTRSIPDSVRPVDENPFSSTGLILHGKPPEKSNLVLARTKSIQEILESYDDVDFPEGSYAFRYAIRNEGAPGFIVRNTPANLAKIDAFFNTAFGRETRLGKSVGFSVHVLQGPGPLLRRLTAQAASKCDHRAELDELLAAVRAGTVKHLDTMRIETTSGTRATAEQGAKHKAVAGLSMSGQGGLVFAQEMREVGFRTELEPTVGADGVTVELTLAPEFHTAEPLEHREFVIDTQGRRLEFPLTDYHVAKLTTGLTLPDGVARLLSLYKPTGKAEFEQEDVLQAIFITCDVLRVSK